MIISGIEILFTQIFEIIQIFGLEALSREELERLSHFQENLTLSQFLQS